VSFVSFVLIQRRDAESKPIYTLRVSPTLVTLLNGMSL